MSDTLPAQTTNNDIVQLACAVDVNGRNVLRLTKAPSTTFIPLMQAHGETAKVAAISKPGVLTLCVG